MRKIRAIFQNGVFTPLESVDLAELTEVEFEPRPVVRPEELANPVDLYTVFERTFKAGGLSARKASE
jgi:predicted DNA-binding antitoxin AbrB/MazE fold protein